jgi:hypothetical protein
MSPIIIRFHSDACPLSDAVKWQKTGQIHLKSEYLIKFIGNIHKENLKFKTEYCVQYCFDILYESFKVLSGYLVRIFSLIVVASQAMVVVEKMGHDISLCGSGILG